MTGSQYGAVHGVFEPRRDDDGTYGALARPLLAPEEPLRGIVAAELHQLVSRLPRRHHRDNGRTGSAVASLALAGLLAGLFGSVLEFALALAGGLVRTVRRLVRGRALVGGWRSTAGRLAIDVRHGPSWWKAPDNDHVLLVFTDHRILLAAETPGRLEAFGELPRAELRRVTVRHTWISNRVDLRFADGSLLAVEAGLDNARALEALLRP